jgi:hypothetical protein
MSLRIEFPSLIKEIGAIQPVKNGFQQINIVHIPESTDEFGYKRYEQFFQVRVYSTAQTDTRFFKSELVGQKKIVCCYLNGKRYMQQGKFDYTYFLILNFIELKPIV